MRVWDVFTRPIGEVAGAAWQRLGGAASQAAGSVKGFVSRRDVLKASAAVAVAGTAAGVVMRIPRRHKFGKTFILYIADACRADVIGKVINGFEVTPNLNRLAERSLHFSNAYSTSNYTKSGVAGILTGEPAPVHGVKWRATTIPLMPTLATYLAGKGYGTLAAVNNRWLEAEKEGKGPEAAGYARGFRKYDLYPPRTVAVKVGAARVSLKANPSDEEMRRRAFGALGARLVDREFPLPAFAWVHSMKTHWPRFQEASNEFTGRFHEKGLVEKLGREKVFEKDMAFVQANPRLWEFAPSGETQIDLLRAMYYEAAADMDLQFARFVEELRRHDSGEATVIFTADHGESLGGEDKEIGHGLGLGESVLRVPLIISGSDFAAATVDKRVSNSWLFQTVMMLSGDYPKDTMGAALDPGKLQGHSPIYAAVREAAAYITEDGTKAVRDDGGDYAFYDVVKDPAEAAPLALDEGRRAELIAGLKGYEARCQEMRKRRGIEPEYTRIGWQLEMSGLKREEIKRIEGVERESETLEKAKIDEMKALGYVQ